MINHFHHLEYSLKERKQSFRAYQRRDHASALTSHVSLLKFEVDPYTDSVVAVSQLFESIGY